MIYRHCWVILLFVSSISYAQNQNEIRAVNNYISFMNESIHGMLIAHRLFETYNQTINQYVDLPDYQLNNYSNADLPDDIFEDPEDWFFEEGINPYNWFERAKRQGQFIGDKRVFLDEKCSQILNILKRTNQKRITIANLLEKSDLRKIENLSKVYTELEEIVAIYDRFYLLYSEINQFIDSQFLSTKVNNSYPKALSDFYSEAKALIHQTRKDQSIRKTDIDAISKKMKSLEVIKIDGKDTDRKQIMTNVSRLYRVFNDYLNDKDVPKQYELYGNHYHYHNVTMLNLTNRYGNGFVSKYNRVAQEKGWIKEMEIPHFYKVIYPKKLDKEELATLDSDQLIEILDKDPPEIKSAPSPIINDDVPITEEIEAPKKEEENIAPIDYNRGIVVHSEVIYVTSDSFDLELYDHLIKDGDRVSIKVNDEWKFKNISLEKEPKVLTIHIKPGQQNFILVHADNTGYQPPNTIAIAYTVNGEKKVINLQTDLENSQMVEIKYGG